MDSPYYLPTNVVYFIFFNYFKTLRRQTNEEVVTGSVSEVKDIL